MNFGVSFTNPYALLLLPPLAVYFIWLARRSLADLSPVRRRVAVGFRLLVTSLVVLAIAGTQLVRFNRDLAVMFVVDYSDSVGPEAKAAARQYIQNAVKDKSPADKWGVIVFGRDAYIDLAPGNSPTLGEIRTVVPSEFTDIAGAIRLGVASLPEGSRKRVVVLSDGNENLGNSIDEALVAKNNDVDVDVVPLASGAKNEVLLERITLPSEAKIGEPLEVKVVARATQNTSAQIKLYRDGKYLGNRNVQLSNGKNVFTFPQTVTEAGAATFEARIESPKGTDTVAENNKALGFTFVQGKPRVLLVSDDPDQAQFLYKSLGREKLNVEIRGAGGVPSDLRQMQPYDAIILDNVPAWSLSTKQMLSLQSYVRDLGCGLVMVGGEYSYGPGGYRSTPVEEALPVTMDIKNMQYIPGGAVAMVMHSCEFPQGNDWAKAVCSQVTRQLGDNDYAGIVVFGMDATWVYKGGMLKVGPNRNSMLTQIRNINPGDMPDFDAALNVAYKGLTNTKAYLKHCIILSDGDPSPPAQSLVAQFNKSKITVSTIVINPHDSSGARSMYDIAKEHNGKFYQVNKPSEIPNIFLKEAATVSRSAIIEGAFNPQKTGESSIIKGIPSTPPLLGYVGTSAKPTSNVVLSSNEKDPVLATWQYGLGKAVAWTSDAQQRWSAGWLPWAGYSKFWAQAVRWSMRQSSSGDLQTNVDIDKGVGKVTIEAVDAKGNFLNFLSPTARLVTPDLKGQDLTLDQTGPGRYEATFDARQLGTYLINIRTKRGDKITSQITGGVLPYSPEYNSVGTNSFLLSQVADQGAGDVLPLNKANQVFTRPRVPARSPSDIWLPLLALAAILFPLDVAVRRLVWDEEDIRNWRAKRRAGKGTTGATGATARDSSTSQLLQSKTARRGGQTPTTQQQTPTTGTGAPQPTAPTATPRPGVPAAPVAPQAPSAPDAAGTVDIPAARPVSTTPTAPPVAETPPTPVAPPEEDPMERLRRAKRRARGEEE